MVLAINAFDLIGIPFGYLMDGMYRITQNYGLAVILFALLISLIMHPLNMKNSINAVKKSRLEPCVKEIRATFPGDVKMQNALMERMYEKENVSLSGGCFMSIIPFFVLIALFSVVSHPLVYVMHQNREFVSQIISKMSEAAPDLFTSGYKEIIASQYIGEFSELLKDSGVSLPGINYNFLGIDLAAVPDLNFTKWEAFDWAHIGLFILPILPVAIRVIPFICGKIKATYYALKRKQNGTYVSESNRKKYNFFIPILMLVFVIGCFQVPGVIALYWFTKSVFDMLLNIRIKRKLATLPLEYASVEDLAEEYFDKNPEARPQPKQIESDENYQEFVARKAYEDGVLEGTGEPAEPARIQTEYEVPEALEGVQKSSVNTAMKEEREICEKKFWLNEY